MLAFQVLVACHVTPRSSRIRRTVSTLIVLTWPTVMRWSRSLTSDQQESGWPMKRGSHRAMTQIQSRVCSSIRLGAPLAPFWIQGGEPDDVVSRRVPSRSFRRSGMLTLANRATSTGEIP